MPDRVQVEAGNDNTDSEDLIIKQLQHFLNAQEVHDRKRLYSTIWRERERDREKEREKETKNVEQSYKDLEELINEVDIDEPTKEKLEKELKEFREAYDANVEGELKRQQDDFDYTWELRKSKDKTDRIIRLLDRDLVAVIIGGVLLLILGIALIVLIYQEKIDPTLLESAFFVILGFFFGQGVSRTRRAESNP